MERKSAVSEVEITFANNEAATYIIESELHGMNLKMLHNNMQSLLLLLLQWSQTMSVWNWSRKQALC